MSESISWPQKTREVHSHHFDSTIWNDLVLRDDDIIISTYAKAGTTWMQQIVAQLLFDGDPDVEVAEMSPWLDLRVPPKEVKLPLVEAQTHRRFMKTHLPVDALRFSPKARYIYIGRDARDVVWSLYNHHSNANASWYEALNDTPGRVGPPIEPPPDDIRQYLHDWLDREGHPFWPFWDAGAEVFINKGVNGRWTETLSDEVSINYERRAEAELGAECARWLATGQGIE